MRRAVQSSQLASLDTQANSSVPCVHDDLRCGCGSLLARRVLDGVELKCRRCKRTVVIPLQNEEQLS
jgi:phage FluMu protein Com